MKPSGNIKYTHDFKPFSVELLPAISTESRIKYTGRERDNFTNYDYMHFRFYASSTGRFLKPDNIIPDVFNPQSWNLYSYVNGNPVNFNDPLGHTGQGMAKPYYFVNGGSASWLNCDTYCAFMSGLYGGNVTFGAGGVYGGGGTQSTGYWKPIYGTIVTTSGEPVWNEELQAWVGLEVKVIWGIVGVKWVEVKESEQTEAKGLVAKKESLWERWLYNFNRTNQAIPGLLAPPGLGLLTGKAISEGLETPTLWQWIKSGLRGVPAAGVEWTSMETFLLGSGALIVNTLAVGAAFEVGIAIGSFIQIVIIEQLQPE